MDHTGAPPDVWLLACECPVDTHNISVNDALHGNAPYSIQHGETPDISACPQFQFWEPISCLDDDESFPNSNEKPGYFTGVAKNAGDTVTFQIITQDAGESSCRSVV